MLLRGGEMILALWIALYAAVFVVVRQGHEEGRAHASEEGCDICFPCFGTEEDEIEEEREVQRDEQETDPASGALTGVPDSLLGQELVEVSILGTGVHQRGHHHGGGDYHHADDPHHH